jgi:putative zinc finger/helix-turn-helix YgiT family protein
MKVTTELNRNGELCPACGEGRLTSRVLREEIEYKGVHGEVPVHYSVCDYCGSELAGSAESRANKRAMTVFKKQVEGLLTGEEIRALRKSFELSQGLAAELFGGGKVAFSRYESDDITQSAAMDSLLRLCAANSSNLLLLAIQKKIDDLPDGFIAKIKAKYFMEDILTMGRKIQYELDSDKFLSKLGSNLSGKHSVHAANNDIYMNSNSQKLATVTEMQAWKEAAA